MYTRVHNILYDEHFLFRAVLDVYWCARKTKHVLLGQWRALNIHSCFIIILYVQVFSRVEIGHPDYMGKQFVYCNPLHKPDSEKQDATTGRMDYVFLIPPPPFYDGRRRDFDLSLENAWYERVSLLFSMKFRTDSGEVRDVDCAMIDVFFNYAEGRCFVCTLVTCALSYTKTRNSTQIETI
jgi:hypothetical protein